MAIHVPLTQAAQMECWNLMLSARNLLDPANGQTIVYPSQDMVLGIYYMTSIKPDKETVGGPVKVVKDGDKFSSEPVMALMKSYITPEESAEIKHKLYTSVDEVRLAATTGAIAWQAEIKVLKSVLKKCVHGDTEATLNEKYILTSAGRIAFNESMPDEVDFYNERLGDKALKAMIESVYHTEQTSDKLVKKLVQEKFGITVMDDVALDKIWKDADTMKRLNRIYNRPSGEPFSYTELCKLMNCIFNVDRSWLTVQMLDAIKATGYKNATFYGATLSMDDILVPRDKKKLVDDADAKVSEYIEQANNGIITPHDRYVESTRIWASVGDKLTKAMYKEMGEDKNGFNTIFMMADSGARGSEKQISQLGAMRGLMQKPNGDIIELPIRSNFKDGLSVIEFFISTNGARKGLSDTALKTADAGYMTRRLVDVAQNVVINEEDCGTINGIDYKAIKKGEEIVESLSSRIAGHFSAERVLDPVDGTLLCDVNQYIDENLAKKIEAAGVEKVKLRTVLTCECKHGLCVKCYGKDLARNKIVEIGEAVGTIAAQSIGQPGTQLTLRTFHTGGAADTSASDNSIKMKYAVYIESISGTHVEKDGNWLLTRRGVMKAAKLFNKYPYGNESEILVEEGAFVRKDKAILHQKKDIYPSDNGYIHINREDKVIYLISRIEDTPLENGSTIFADFVKGNRIVEKGKSIGKTFENAEPIICEQDGYVHYEDVIPGVTFNEKDRSITEIHLDVKQPQIKICDEAGNPLGSYHLPAKTTIEVAERIDADHYDLQDGVPVKAGDILAKIPVEGTKANDITLGLPRVSELFEGRKSKDPAVIAQISGTVRFGKIIKSKLHVIVRDEFDKDYVHNIPIQKRLLVRDGDYVKAGDPLCTGSKDPHDVLAVLGENELQNFLMDEIQSVYRSQKVNISDKHIGTIIRQMLRKVEVVKVGDTKFIFGEQVDKYVFREENERIMAGGGEPAVARPMFQGITKAALATDSFISASSFQETTKVLTNAAIAGETDNLRGLKENVIIGHMIPAGTGMKAYHNIKLSDSSSEDLDAKMMEILEIRRQERELAAQTESMEASILDTPDED